MIIFVFRLKFEYISWVEGPRKENFSFYRTWCERDLREYIVEFIKVYVLVIYIIIVT